MDRPGVSVYVRILRDDRLLLGLRKGGHGAGTWQCPGGKLDMGESYMECAIRETWEETSLEITCYKCDELGITNNLQLDEGLHYVSIFMNGGYNGGEARVMEPENCGEWRWFEKSELPGNLYLPVQNFIKGGHNLFAL